MLGEDQNPMGKNLDEEEKISEEGEKEQSKWFRFHRDYTEEEKRLLFSKVVIVALETTFPNHIYQCQNNLYRQSQGGGIGASITGVLAQILMDVWMDLVSKSLEEKISLILFIYY